MKALLALALFLMSQSYWACAVRTLGPEDPSGSIIVAVRFSSTTGGPEQPIDIQATATNATTRTVYRAMPCMTPDGLSQKVLGPDGKEVRLSWSTVDPACPDGCCAALAKGEEEKDALKFTGKVYNDRGQTYDAPAGTYTVVASFSSTDRADSRNGFTVVEERATFEWNVKVVQR